MKGLVSSICFTGLILSSATTAAEAANAQENQQSNPPNDTRAGLAERETLFGDWGGIRQSAQDSGITWELSFTSVYADILDSDAEDESSDWGHRIDVFARIETGRLGFWEGGSLNLHIESKHGDSADREFARSGGLLPPNSSATTPLGDSDRLVASSIYYNQTVEDSGVLMLGKINALDLLANDPFFGGGGRDRFSNIAFSAPPSGVVPPVIMGAIYTQVINSTSFTFMLFDPNDSTDDYGLSGLFDDGINVSLTSTWRGELQGRNSSLGINGTYSTKRGTDLRDLTLPPDLEGGNKKGSYNLSVTGSHLLLESTLLPGKGLGIYGKAAVADSNPNPIRWSFVGGLAAYGMIPGRRDDVVAIGYYHYDLSNDLRLGAAPLADLDSETGIEIFYKTSITSWLQVTADLQWIEPVVKGISNSWLGGIRASVNF